MGCGNPEDKEAIKAYKTILKLIDEGAIPSPISKTSFGWEIDAFLTGKVGMYISGPWNCMSLGKKGVSFLWDMALIPKGKRRINSLGVYGYAISKDTKDQEASFKLIKFLTSPEIEKDIAYSGRSFPASKKASNFWLADPLFDKINNKDAVRESLKYSKVYIKSPKFAEIDDVLHKGQEEIFLKKVSVEEGLKKIYEKVNALL